MESTDLQPAPSRLARAWACEHCGDTAQVSETRCEACQRPRFASWAIQIAEHVLEHLADGLNEPLDVLKALQGRPCYARAQLTLAFVAQQMRLLTKDTTALAHQILKARAARHALEVSETGDNKDKIALLKLAGLSEVMRHEVDQVTRFVVETHDGPPPAPPVPEPTRARLGDVVHAYDPQDA